MTIPPVPAVLPRLFACLLALSTSVLGDPQEGASPTSFSVSPTTLDAADEHTTPVILDARAVTAGSDEELLAVRWIAPGATFVQGTTSSPLASVTYPGGANYPVTLVVTTTSGATSAHVSIAVTGEPINTRGTHDVWYPLQVWIEGPPSGETDDAPNPFLDYRLNVTFVGPSGQSYLVPGFFAGDGKGGGVGKIWKARFAPDEPGAWTFTASFRAGTDVAVSLDPEAGSPVASDGVAGRTYVHAADGQARGFYRKGRLAYVGEHFLRFADGSYFLKGGTGSPENLFGYRGFDHIQDNGNSGILHKYGPHFADFEPGGPLFMSKSTGFDSRGLVGALDYLGSVEVNSIYFLPMNLGGDAQDTTPFGYVDDAYDKTHYDISRLAQWNQILILIHAQKRGLLAHLVLAETELENEEWLDSGELGVERKLFYREMVARFGHLMALKWNLSEESDYSVQHLRDFAAYIAAQDPHDHPICVGTHPDNFRTYEELVGEAPFSTTAVQYSQATAGDSVEYLRGLSKAAGRPWVIDMNECTLALSDTNTSELRRKVMYDVYFSGGELEWYAGGFSLPVGGDHDLEDFRTREDMWIQMGIARRFIEDHLPFWEMEPSDDLLLGETVTGTYGPGEVFAKRNEVYAVYLPISFTAGSLDLTSATGTFEGRWFNPRTGDFEGTTQTITGGGLHDLGAVPADPGEDWVFLVAR